MQCDEDQELHLTYQRKQLNKGALTADDEIRPNLTKNNQLCFYFDDNKSCTCQ